MATSSKNRRARPSHPPLWLVEGLDIVVRRRWVVAAVIVVVVALGAIAALVFPATIPPTAGVGAAVGVAALLLGLAAAVAGDATDLIVRGPRHVAAAGGELVAVVPRDPSVAAAGPLAAAIEEVREPDSPLLLAFATAGRDARRTVAWTDAIARSLVGRRLGVLRVDLASGRSEVPGLVEVVRDDLRLADVVEFEPKVKLARLRAGRDHGEALAALTELPARLPSDLDILLVSLPTAVSRPVVTAAAALDHVLVVVERDRTSRVDLIASLDALEAAGTDAQVVLLDTSTALRLAPPVEVDPEQETGKRGIASTLGMPPKVVPGAADDAVEVGPDSEALDGADDERAPEPDSPGGAPDVQEGSAPVDGDDATASRDPDGAAPRRDVEVLEAAAAATARSITEAEQQPFEEQTGSGDDEEAATPEELPLPQEEPRLESPVTLVQDPEPEPEPDPAPQPDPDPLPEPELAPEPATRDLEDTDRIPRVDVPDGSRLDREDPAEEDLLRTTAQLAMLTQDLDLRDTSASGSSTQPGEASDRDDDEAR